MVLFNLNTKYKATIEIYKHENNKWGYRIKARNGQILVHSEGYESKGNSKQGVKDLFENLGLPTNNIVITEAK